MAMRPSLASESDATYGWRERRSPRCRLAGSSSSTMSMRMLSARQHVDLLSS